MINFFFYLNRYGKVFKSHIFGSPTIISTDAEVNRSILQSDAKTFVPFYPKSLTELMGKSSILLINGSLQRRIHGLIGSFFKSPHIKARITHDMKKYVQKSMDNWQENCPVYIQHQAKNVSFHFPSLFSALSKKLLIFNGTFYWNLAWYQFSSSATCLYFFIF